MEGEFNTVKMDCEMEEELCMFPTHITEAPDINIQSGNKCTTNITLN